MCCVLWAYFDSFACADATVILSADAHISEQINMVFAHTRISKGEGYAIVVAIGTDTQAAKIDTLRKRSKEPPTDLQKEMKSLAWKLVLLCLVVCGIVIGVGLARGEPYKQLVLMALSLAFATIPEELPILIKCVLGVGAVRLADSKLLIKVRVTRRDG
jgi:Ca2+-transporting ATPase